MPRRKTKIICTIGPATSSYEMLEKLAHAGMNVARLNMSHGDHEGHARVIEFVREAASRSERPVGILADLQGPKIRVGRLAEPIELHSGDTAVFAPEGSEAPGELPTTYHELASEITAGDVMLLDVSGSYVRSDNRLVVAIGLDDVVVVDTPDATLVVRRDRSEDVKQIVEELKAKRRPEAD